MNRLLAVIAFIFTFANTAVATPKIDAKLSVIVDKSGHVRASMDVSNNGDRPVCLLTANMEVHLLGSDGRPLGEMADIDFGRPTSVDVIWSDGFPETFDLYINGGHDVNGQTVFSQQDLSRLTKATTYFQTFDCVDFLANSGTAKPRIKRELNSSPTFLQ